MSEYNKSKSFEDLLTWQRAHSFVLDVYKTTSSFPREELFGLTSQFRRVAVSIAANIAEGYKKRGLADKLRFLNISQGSLEECRYYVILSADLTFLTLDQKEKLLKELTETSILLNSYCKGIIENAKHNETT